MCNNYPSQDQLLSVLDRCLLEEATTHKLWSREEFKLFQCGKEYEASVFFTFTMVQHHLSGHNKSKVEWINQVLKDWQCNDEPALAFLMRANKFLRDLDHSINGITIIESIVRTNSYVVFLQMHRLATLLFFGFLEASRLEFASDCMCTLSSVCRLIL